MEGKQKKRHSLTFCVILVLTLTILPFNILAMILAVTSLGNVRDRTLLSVQNMAQLAMEQLDSRISATNNLFYSLTDRKDFSVYARQEERTNELILAESALASYFSDCTSNGELADGIFWQSDAYDSTYVSLKMEGASELVLLNRKERLKKALKEKEEVDFIRWSLYELEGEQWLMKTYETNGLYYGAFFSLDDAAGDFLRTASFEGMEVRFSTAEELQEAPEGMLSVHVKSENADLEMQVLLPKKAAYTGMTGLQTVCLVLVFLYVLLIPLLIWLLRRLVLRPLKTLGGAMQRLRDGEQDYRLSPERERTEEFYAVDGHFNDMAERIRTLKIENYEKELEKKQVEITNLQLQIRPHFLLNLFNLLYSMAQIESYAGIQKLALYLSDYFRFIFRNGTDAQPFEREFLLIQKYLEISNLRYPGWYEVSYEIEEEVLETEVPPLLIHNFIENIFKHARVSGRVIHIRLEAYRQGTNSVFVIADDGCGMTDEEAERINTGRFHKKDEEGEVHVGVENSWRRLRSLYGEKAFLQVESSEGRGTCFTITIPEKEE